MAVTSHRLTIGATATRLNVTPDDDPEWVRTDEGRRVEYAAQTSNIAVQNLGDAPVYLGAADVTAATGFPLPAGATLGVELAPDDETHAIADPGPVPVAVFQSGT